MCYYNNVFLTAYRFIKERDCVRQMTHTIRNCKITKIYNYEIVNVRVNNRRTEQIENCQVIKRKNKNTIDLCTNNFENRKLSDLAANVNLTLRCFADFKTTKLKEEILFTKYKSQLFNLSVLRVVRSHRRILIIDYLVILTIMLGDLLN